MPDPDRFMTHLEPPAQRPVKHAAAQQSTEPKVSETLESVVCLLGGFYKNLISHGIPEQLAAACVLQVLDSMLATDGTPRRDESTSTTSI